MLKWKNLGLDQIMMNFQTADQAPRSNRAVGRLLLFLAILPALLIPGPAGAGKAGDGETSLVMLWNGLRINADYAAILVPPGSDQVLSFAGAGLAADVKALSCSGAGKCAGGGGSVFFNAPEMPGNYELKVKLEVKPARTGHGPGSVASAGDPGIKKITIACLVGYPSSMLRDGYLLDFELGEYPTASERSAADRRLPPPYFYYLDREVLGRFISENIRLGDLGYDGRAPLPQYFALDYELVRKLDLLHSELQKLGLPSRFHFIGGGFISPKSNKVRTSKNSAAANQSRHMWGEAVDFIIDESPRDEIMDDMNEDGVIDVRDAFVVRDILTELEESSRCKPGGIGVYAPPRNSQIQLHVDVRGAPIRWGVKEYDSREFAGVPPKKSLRPGG